MIDMSARGLRPAGELAASRQHGDRLRYMSGCRCGECRAANSRYERVRQKARKAGDWNGIVPSDKARAHIRKLARQGVGRRSISAAADVPDSIVFAIRAGKKPHIRARTERKILAVTPAMRGDRSLVPAGPLWRRIGLLLEEGYTKTQLAKMLGYAAALQFNKRRVTARSDADVAALYRRLTT